MHETYDVAVIGGGPAGMMAAATAARSGHRVILLEKNKTLGVKLRLTGGGRCNVTNHRPVVRDLVMAYGSAGKFLYSLFSQYAVTDTIEYFRTQGVVLVEEAEGRMFPSTQQAETIARALEIDVAKQGVVVSTGTAVTAISKTPSGFLVECQTKQIACSRCVIAVGGTARPDTGSTGDGFRWLRALGHTVTEDTRALVPLKSNEPWLPSLGGVALPTIGIAVVQGGVVVAKRRGKLLFTHTGVSGPGVLQLSHVVGDILRYGAVALRLDLLPDSDVVELRAALQEALVAKSNQKLKNVLALLIPSALTSPLLTQLGIDGDTKAHSVSRENRLKLVTGLKQFEINITALHGLEKAVVAGGGVDLTEIDFRTMESRLVPGLYVVGDVLNINRPSGGYSLQLCWSTGAVAGAAVSR